MSYPTYMPMMQPMAQQPMMQPGSFSQRPAMQAQPMRQMYGVPSTLIRVNGRAGADAYYMDAPNSEVALFDANEDIFYVKATDGGGYPTMRAFRFEPVSESATAAVAAVSREEFEQLRSELNELKGALSNAKQPVRAKSTKAAAEPEE